MVPYLVLLMALGLTVALTLFAARNVQIEGQRRFESAANELESRIVVRMEAYVAILRSGAALLAAHPGVDRAAFRMFVDRLRLDALYPGALGVGYTARILPEELASTIERMQREGHPDFEIRPADPRPEYHAILFLEPLDRRNLAAIGFDMWTEATRRAAMARARDTAGPAASGPVTLVQEIDEQRQPGFLIYVPVYRGGVWPRSESERRQMLQGYVYSPFRAHDLFNGILEPPDRAALRVAVYHGEAQAGRLLYSTPGRDEGGRFAERRKVQLYGAPWILDFASTPNFEGQGNSYLPNLVLLLGVGVSLLAFSLTRRESVERLRAEEAGRRLEQSEGERMRLLEAERAARHEAEKANLMKDEFLATLSHELRTPLNAVLGWTHILQRSQDASVLSEGLTVIERNARAQAALIADLLDMNRIMAGKVKLDVQTVAMRQVLEAALDTVRPAAAAKRISIDTDIDPSVGELMGDPARLQQVFWNLLSNAVKFTPEEGTVCVDAARQGQRVVVRVRDTGRGIAPTFLPHVFERFRQAEASPSRSSSGLGLGLAIVRQLVEMHGGRVRADSRGEGRGASFTVELPLRPPQPAPEAEETPRQPAVELGEQQPAASLDGVTVLVVDDEPDSLDVVRRLLEACKARVVSTRSAREALHALRQVKPTVLLSDVAMPGIDGYQLIREVRSLGEDVASVPAAALTAYASAKDRERVMQAGFQAYLTKPVQPAELTRTVAALARRT